MNSFLESALGGPRRLWQNPRMPAATPAPAGTCVCRTRPVLTLLAALLSALFPALAPASQLETLPHPPSYFEPAPPPALPTSDEGAAPPPADDAIAPGAPPAALPEPAVPAAALALATLLFPVPGGKRAGLATHFLSKRGRKRHHAVDIVAPRHTPIRAVADGTIRRLRRSRRGGIGIEQIDGTGQYCYYYAHLQRYAPGLAVGQQVSRDDLLGFVGSTGRARGAHLHFQVMRLEPGQDCWEGQPLDPYPLLEPQAPARAELPAPPRLEAE
jgi:murein DD-endopeptidase MepM/ murein hydrolase activator NlpD